MKPLKKSFVKFLKSRARWNTKIQANAMIDEDVELIVNTTILGELCFALLDWNEPRHFQFLDVDSLLESAPNLFFEYVCLEKKYQAAVYNEAHAGLVAQYERVLWDMYKGNPTLQTFSLISMVSRLQNQDTMIKTKNIITFTPNLFEHQPREAIEAIINLIFVQTNFGLRTTTTLDVESIALLESHMTDAIDIFDFLFVCRALRTLSYVNAPVSSATKKAVRFLQNYKPRRINLILEEVTEKGRQKLDEDTEMVKLNKEIVIAILEWNTNFRFYRDLGTAYKFDRN